MLPMPILLEIDPGVVVPWSAIEALIGGLLSIFAVVVAYAHKSDIKAVRIRADSAVDEVGKVAKDLTAAKAETASLRTELANERTERIVLEGKLAVLRAESQVREELRSQNLVLDHQTMMLEAIAKRTGSVRDMPAARASSRDERRDSTDPPPAAPRLPAMRDRLPSRR